MSFASEVKKELMEKKNVTNADVLFLKDAFLKGGTISNPNKSYRIEFRAGTREFAEHIRNIINNVTDGDIVAHISIRLNEYVVYVKVAEAIIDLLTCMGATYAAMEVMQVKMLKDVRNWANRTTNFDTANLDKTVLASQKQIAAIEKIRDTEGLESLPEGFREIAKLRLTYPEMSLKVLGESLQKPLSRSGVNHRLTKIMEIAKLEEK